MDNFFRLLKQDSIFGEKKTPSKDEGESSEANDADSPSVGSSSTKPVAIPAPDDAEDGAEDEVSSYGSVDDRGSSFGESSIGMAAGLAEVSRLADEKAANAVPANVGLAEAVLAGQEGSAPALTAEEEVEQAKSLFKLPGDNLVEVHAPNVTSTGSLTSLGSSTGVQPSTADSTPASVEQEVVPEASAALEEAVAVEPTATPEAAGSTEDVPAPEAVAEVVSAAEAMTETEKPAAEPADLVEASGDGGQEAYAAELEAQLDAEVEAAVATLGEQEDQDNEEVENEEWEGEDEEEEGDDEDDETLLAQQNEFIEALRQAARNAQEAAQQQQQQQQQAVAEDTPAAAPVASATSESAPRGLGSAALPALPPRRGMGPASVAPVPTPPQPEETPAEKERREKFLGFRVRLLRAASRFGEGLENSTISQVMYRLRLLEQAMSGGRVFPANVDVEAGKLAAELEANAEEGAAQKLEMDCTVLVLGKAGSGKTATIRNILGLEAGNALEPTNSVVETEGVLNGVRIKFIDTPGLYTAVDEQGRNSRILSSIKKHVKKHTPDVVLFFDRFDWISTALNDLPLFRTITSVFGPTLWYNAMVVMSHGGSSPPDDSRGNPINYDTYLAQRTFILQQCVRQASGEVRLQVPSALVENHPNCRKNRAGDPILPNGMAWKTQLLLMFFASITLNSTNEIMRAHEAASKKKAKKGLFGRLKELVGLKGGQQTVRIGPGGIRVLRPRHNTLPYMLSQLLQPKEPLRMAEDPNAMEEELDEDLMEDDFDLGEDESLPPFTRLSKADLDSLTPHQRKEYFAELKEREKLIRRQQFREQVKQRREMKKYEPYMKEMTQAQKEKQKQEEEEQEQSRGVGLLPEIALPPSFDADNPSYRYRALDNSPWVVRPLLGQQSWDHDPGFDTFSVERSVAFLETIPAAVTGQISKDKNEGSIMLEGSASKWHGDISNSTRVTTAGFDVQSMGKDTSYTVRVDHRVPNFHKNRTSAGLSLNMIAGILSYGLKLENRLSLGRRGKVSGGVGLVSGKGDRAMGTQLEASFNHSKDFPLDRSNTTIGASVMEWQKDISLGVNAASNFHLGTTSVNSRVNLNNRGAGQLSVKFSSNDHLSLALVGLIPIVRHYVGYRLLGMGQEGAY